MPGAGAVGALGTGGSASSMPLVERLPDDAGSYLSVHQRICGNDQSQWLSDNPVPAAISGELVIRLDWKASKADREYPVGVFRLHISSLLAGGFIYRETTTGRVRTRIHHEAGEFYLRRKKDGPSICLSRLVCRAPASVPR